MLSVRGSVLPAGVRCCQRRRSLSRAVPAGMLGARSTQGRSKADASGSVEIPEGGRGDSPALSALPYLVPPTPRCPAQHAQLPLLRIPKPAACSASLSLVLAVGHRFSSDPRGSPSPRLPRDGRYPGPCASFSLLTPPGAAPFPAPCPVPRCGDPGTDTLWAGQCPIPTPTCPRILSPESLVLPLPSIPLIIPVLSVTRRCHPDIPLPVQPSRGVTPLFCPDPALPGTSRRSGEAVCDSPKECIRAGFPFPTPSLPPAAPSSAGAVPGVTRIPGDLPVPLSPLPSAHPSQLSSCALGSGSGFGSLGSGFLSHTRVQLSTWGGSSGQRQFVLAGM